MAITSNGPGYGNVTATTTLGAIVSFSTDFQHYEKRNGAIYNNGSVTVYIGYDTSLTSSNGFPLPAGDSFAFNTKTTIYGVTASSTADLRWIMEEA